MAFRSRFDSKSSIQLTPFHGRFLNASTPSMLPLQGDAVFGNDVVEWLKSLGYKKEINPNLIKRLCPKSHRNMWYHLMKHVRPAQEVDLVKKNVLIANMEKDQNKYKKPLKAIVNTPEDFNNYKKWMDLKSEIAVKESEVRAVTGDIRALQLKTRLKEHQIKATKEQMSDCSQKNDLLKRKIKQENDKLKSLRNEVDTSEVLINKAFNLKKEESSTDKISSFMSELENLYHTRQIDQNEQVPFENDLLWNKVDELVMMVPPNDILNYISSSLVSINEKLNEELVKFTKLKASVLQAGNNDFTNLQQSLKDTFSEYLDLEKETILLKANIEALKLQVTDNIIKKFSLTPEAHESIMMYLNHKCSLAFYEERSKSHIKVISDMQFSDKVVCLENLISMRFTRVEQMNASIEEKSQILPESIRILLNEEGQRKIAVIRAEILAIISEFSSANNEEDSTLLNLRGALKNEVSLFLKVPLQKNRKGDKPPLPSSLQYFPLNRQKHLLPLQIFAQRLQIAETEKLMSTLSETQLVNRMADRDKKSLAMVKEMRENSGAELKNKMMMTMNVIQEAEKDLLKAKKYAELLDQDKSLNKLLLRRNPSVVEEFVKYEEILRKSLVELNDLITKNN
ncbi:hypothetical protein LSTR_LSTR009486 [Laodelphax striatellus]|uniref:Uncharacterized protein n=1 Tax=Laodelphax striatellus TaxID=195883 RepID=A0A482WFJ6_LAOST|nr:hypothetical protein LSTR_LSTR009486 [Laodelphax striatellus]